MKKALFNILFVIFHLVASFWGSYLICSFWFGIEALQHHSVALISILIFLPANCVYLILMRKEVIGTATSIICFSGSLLFYGPYSFIVLILRTFSSYFELSLFSISHTLVLISLFVQCCIVLDSLQHRTKKPATIKEFKTPPCVIARTQRIRYPIFYTSFKKHYCPNCTTRLRLIKKSKMVVSNISEINDNLNFGTGSPEENVRFIWKEFQCPSCKTEFTIENIKKIEQNNQ